MNKELCNSGRAIDQRAASTAELGGILVGIFHAHPKSRTAADVFLDFVRQITDAQQQNIRNPVFPQEFKLTFDKQLTRNLD